MRLEHAGDTIYWESQQSYTSYGVEVPSSGWLFQYGYGKFENKETKQVQLRHYIRSICHQTNCRGSGKAECVEVEEWHAWLLERVYGHYSALDTEEMFYTTDDQFNSNKNIDISVQTEYT